MLTFYCERPHEKEVDFEHERFIVATGRGLEINGVHFDMGDEVPQGALSSYALRCEYERPLRHIETRDYAIKIGLIPEGGPANCEAHARGVGPTPQEQPPTENKLDQLSRDQLAKLCRRHNESDRGTKEQLRERLRPILG